MSLHDMALCLAASLTVAALAAATVSPVLAAILVVDVVLALGVAGITYPKESPK